MAASLICRLYLVTQMAFESCSNATLVMLTVWPKIMFGLRPGPLGSRVFHTVRAAVMVCLGLGLVYLPGVIHPAASHAQSGAVQWGAPINLSNTASSSAQPTVAADPYGNVHVFWSEDVDGDPLRPEEAPRAGNAIHYTRWDGQTWSPPLDVVWRTRVAQYPQAVVDRSGTLHLVWVEGNGIYYSSAPAWAATTALSWAPPSLVAAAGHARGAPCLGLDSEDGLHLAYVDWGNAYTPTDGNVYYVHMTPNDHSWSKPVQISLVPTGEEVALNPRMAIDGGARVHMVWGQYTWSPWASGAVYYARIAGGDEVSSPPREIMRRDPDDVWMTAINVVTVGDQVHLTWVCGQMPYRCHQWSVDGGNTWSPPNHVFGELLSLAGWDALAVDAAQNIYWVMQLRHPYAMYYSTWQGTQWADPPEPFILEEPMASGHVPAVAVGLGNQLHLVMLDQEVGEVYYIRGSTTAPAIPPRPTPTAVLSTPTPELVVVSPTVAPTQLATPTHVPTAVSPTVPDSTTPWPLIVGIVPVVLGLVMIVLLRQRRHR